MQFPVLHLFCGKIASGKSTLAAKLAAQDQTVLISEDAWLGALYAEQMKTLADYARCSGRLRDVMADHITGLLKNSVSVVLDFPANTRSNRDWMREIIDGSGAAHELHLLGVPDDVGIARLHARNAQGKHPFSASEAEYHQISKYFDPPAPDEGFNIVRHD